MMSLTTAGLPPGLTPPLLLSLGIYSIIGRTKDVVLLIAFLLYWNRNWTFHVVIEAHPQLSGQLLGGAAAAFLTLQLFRSALTKRGTPRWSGPGDVLLLPCTTTHTRRFPKSHSFSYSYLVVGIPVGWKGSAGGLVSSGAEQSSGLSSWFSLKQTVQKGWFDVDAADYLERGSGHLGLRGKLDAFLSSQGADPSDYPHAYLITAAKFLGYHFNPVSLWYLYGRDKSLAAMILEVNNTFGERRMYFLDPAEPTPSLQDTQQGGSFEDHLTVEGEKAASAGAAPSEKFKQQWEKDFHVSPFNSRKGSYSLIASDPLMALLNGETPINVTINLRSSKQHGKMVARLFSDGSPPLDPYGMSSFQKLKFLCSWWWVGFVTFPRIVKEAGTLFFRRNLHVWYRPEPLKESLGREADETERRLEAVFRSYLRHLVEQSKDAVVVKYVPGGISAASKELMLSPSARDGAPEAKELEFLVLTPAFYSRFVYYAHDLEALFSEFRENCTIWLSRPDLLPRLILRKPTKPLATFNPIDYVCFKLIQSLRRRPERIERPLTSASNPAAQTHMVTDIRDFRISAMDAFVLGQEDTKVKDLYKAAVLKLFVADRIALGMVPLLDAGIFVLRMCLAGVTSHWLSTMLSRETSNFTTVR